MDINSHEFANYLDKIIEQKVQQLVNAALNRFGIMHGWVGKVVAVNANGTVNVQLFTGATSPSTIPNLLNKSGVTLNVNDEVELHSISSLINAYVAVKK